MTNLHAHCDIVLARARMLLISHCYHCDHRNCGSTLRRLAQTLHFGFFVTTDLRRAPSKAPTQCQGDVARLALLISFLGIATNVLGGERMVGGFNRDEASQMLLLSADIDGFGLDGVTLPPPDTSRWELVSKGVKSGGGGDGGYGPFDNEWKLWRNKQDSATFAVAIRGTVYDKKSIVEDFIATTLSAEKIVIPAGRDKSISFRLASTSYRSAEGKDGPVAEVHAGFAYGLAAVLFDRTYGLLNALKGSLPVGSRLYITGHSQGAAIATLLYSFMHYACAKGVPGELPEDERINFANCGRFGLADKNLSIKGYVFAQPKPGNWRYAMDLGLAGGNSGLFFTINNFDDPVVQVPLAFQLVSDSLTRQEIGTLPQHHFLAFLTDLAHGFRTHISITVDEGVLDDNFLRNNGGGSYADQLDETYVDGRAKRRGGSGSSSLNYVPAGTVISVRALSADTLAYEKVESPDNDFLWEHHLWRYQQLSKYWP